MTPDPYIPFCGTPPLPSELLSRWTFEPGLLAALAFGFVIGWIYAPSRRRFASAWALITLLFISPLCAASMSLFSARVAQHILLTLLAAPLLASALPRWRLPALPLAVVFAVLFWVWHAPGPYAATLQSDFVYWSMHISLFAAATALFVAIRSAPPQAIPAAAITGAQMTAYAMLLTFAPEPWHGWHALTTVPYGLTALSDQQLAGALMWVAGGALFLGLVGLVSAGFLRDSDPRQQT